MSRQLRIMAIALAVLVSSHAFARSPFSLVKFRKSKEVAKSSYLLTEENGPWMIFVTSFAGDGAEAEARQLVQKLRTDFGLNAYVHKKHYDYRESVEGKGFDKYGNPKKMRYASGQAYDEVAVLVGDFEEVDDSKMQKSLKTIKFATAEELALKGSKQNPTTRRFAGMRSIMQKKLQRAPKKQRKGPLGSAFATRNPMTPRAGHAKGLDPLLIEMNKGVRYSLLENTGKYTVRVASYRGEVVIDQKKIHEIETNQRQTDNRIDTTDEMAEGLAALLRGEGVEAYVYHDRHESIVTIGSFDEIGTKRADGKIELDPKVAQIIQTYGPSKKRLPGHGIALAGIQPKAKSKGRGHPTYVFDVAPQPVLVPRRSIANDYLSFR